MGGWTEFILAFAAFFASHAIPARPAVRARLVARLGRAGYGAAYGIVSLLVLAWLIGAAGRAPYVELWPWAPWQAHVPVTLMLPVCLILALALGRPNPFSFGGARNDAFDPARPGIVRWLRHPVLAALALWAGAHLVPNGDLAHVFLFGLFAGFALLGMRIIDRRKARLMGAEWDRLRAEVARAPLTPRPLSWGGAVVRLALGVAAYGALIALHPWLFGVSPLP